MLQIYLLGIQVKKFNPLPNIISKNTIAGICLEISDANNISYNIVNENYYGIYLHHVESLSFELDYLFNHLNTIRGNKVNSNNYGIWIGGGWRNSISENRMNGCGVFVLPIGLYNISTLINPTNLVNGKPLYLLL